MSDFVQTRTQTTYIKLRTRQIIQKAKTLKSSKNQVRFGKKPLSKAPSTQTEVQHSVHPLSTRSKAIRKILPKYKGFKNTPGCLTTVVQSEDSTQEFEEHSAQTNIYKQRRAKFTSNYELIRFRRKKFLCFFEDELEIPQKFAGMLQQHTNDNDKDTDDEQIKNANNYVLKDLYKCISSENRSRRSKKPKGK